MLTPILRLISNRFVPTLILCAIAALWFSTGAALAGRVVLSGTHSESDILKTCVGAGGTFSSGPGGYGCVTDKGQVSCNKGGKCYGECPNCGPAVKHKGATALGVLSGTTLKKIGTAAPTKPPVKPIHTKLPADSNPSATSNNEAHHDKKK